jgi:hypothetical protein
VQIDVHEHASRGRWHRLVDGLCINFWRRNEGDTSERGPDSPHADFRAIADARGRIVVIMTHNTDIGDSMERESEDPEFFARFSPNGYALATDIVLYALTH